MIVMYDNHITAVIVKHWIPCSCGCVYFKKAIELQTHYEGAYTVADLKKHSFTCVECGEIRKTGWERYRHIGVDPG